VVDLAKEAGQAQAQEPGFFCRFAEHGVFRRLVLGTRARRHLRTRLGVVRVVKYQQSAPVRDVGKDLVLEDHRA
jgi:hypothetical protein